MMNIEESHFYCETLEHEQLHGAADIAFFSDVALTSGGPILELGCGIGRISIPLAMSGVDVVGLDISLGLLESFRRKIDSCPSDIRQRIRLLRADMRRFALRERFRCIICSSNTLLLSGSDDDLAETIACAATHLLDNGIAVFDVDSIDDDMEAALQEYSIAAVPDAVFTAPDGRILQRTHRLKLVPSQCGAVRVAVSYEYFTADGRKYAERSEKLAFIRPDKLLSLVKNSGLNIIETYGWYDRRPFNRNERKLLIVAGKREHQ
ncbi:MAG: class I SAM-dependent methyltransferase [Candidatus Abyssobacteria bacterium SURF_5]|uniref:Class I SAM-dependent methyltransferase n=1 Tax=Abyssobacteria bacterium (strain SURF_5) TaxID=2093360 RepID=A0A3A4NYC0_ABYX5|nr:MAG: class I SAM-dependent methyltransferase [Candidatus Abyssubacteria bacterium SURF_5]